MAPYHDAPSDNDAELPDFWSYIDIHAFGLAEDDFLRAVGQDRAFLLELAAEIVRLRVGVVVEQPPKASDVDDAAEPWQHRGDEERRLQEQIRDLRSEMRESQLAIARRSPAEWPPELRFAVELRLAARFLGRARSALDRYGDLQPMIVHRQVPARAQPYMAELVDLYLTGFDAATVAFACSCFEQVAKDALIATGKCTEPQLKREKPAAEPLLHLLTQNSLIEVSRSLADRLVRNRNTLLHSHWPDAKIDSRRQALDAIESLLEVCKELESAWPYSA